LAVGIPVVVLEPSCATVFRDELKNLFPHDEDAKRLASQTFLLSEFLEKKAKHYQPPQLQRKAVVHAHCHHKAIMKMSDEQSLLAKLGLDFEVLDSGCCGMAGAFGFEKDHYDVSIKVGERVLLPAVREADKQTLIIANGFSCREQIAQTTDRRALHVAQVLQMALHEGQNGTAKAEGGQEDTPYPEARYMPSHQQSSVQSQAKLLPTLLLSAGVLLVGGVFIWLYKKRG
ncbi:MAG: hypothetical protein JO183_05890, partial [Ktedonobacteraceae bacterium]|nr:hypothetical protein [Ktedonobacteraceae bacterium]